VSARTPAAYSIRAGARRYSSRGGAGHRHDHCKALARPREITCGVGYILLTRAAPARADAGATFPTRNDIDAGNRAKLVSLLNQHLADTFDLMSQTKFAHWNVKGPNFYHLHLLFDTLAEKVSEHVDDIAERVTALGGVATGTARQSAATSRVPEFPAGVFKDMAVVAALADRYAAVSNAMRDAIDDADELGDKDTADLFTEVSRDLDKSLYFLESHLQG
jgi:starvation-inducible DNA-binding protein